MSPNSTSGECIICINIDFYDTYYSFPKGESPKVLSTIFYPLKQAKKLNHFWGGCPVDVNQPNMSFGWHRISLDTFLIFLKLVTEIIEILY